MFEAETNDFPLSSLNVFSENVLREMNVYDVCSCFSSFISGKVALLYCGTYIIVK